MTGRRRWTTLRVRPTVVAVLALIFAIFAAPGLTGALGAAAQGPNFHLPVDSLDHLLREAPFQWPDELESLGAEGSPSRRTTLRFDDGARVPVKWVPAPEGGHAFNRAPRYELAAYRLQKLFLDPERWVVPPTAIRSVPLERYRELEGGVAPTFAGTESVLVTLQYFLRNVTPENVFDSTRFAADTAYARRWADLNLLTYLIHHNDSNEGNLLISTDSAEPRVFAVDNGLAFESPWAAQGHRWRVLQVRRYPAESVERLRALEREELRAALAVLAHFELRDGGLARTGAGQPLDPEAGVRRRNGVVQLGLTDAEIQGVWERIGRFLDTVDRGRMTLF